MIIINIAQPKTNKINTHTHTPDSEENQQWPVKRDRVWYPSCDG